MEEISRFVALVFFIGVAFVGAINNDFFVFGISSHTKEFLKNMATPELPVKLCILVYGFYFAILILRTMLNKLRELLRGLFIVNDDLDRLKIVATKKLHDKGVAEIPISYELNGIKRIPVTLPIWSASSFNNNNLPDLTCEFAELMGFIASVAVDIRMYSSYGGGVFRLDIEQDTSSSQAADDLKYLSHILHNLHMFQDKNCENIIFACEQHIDMYKSYMSTETFKRHKKYVDLNKAIKIFEQIKAKCRCSVS